jgi:hypothetical protein
MAAFEYRQAQKIRSVLARHGYCHLFIASKAATGRIKDKESLPRLQAFRQYLLEQR